MSEIKDIAAALAKAQSEFEPIIFNRTMQIQGRKDYKYADLASILDAVRPALNKNGISLLQPVVSRDGQIGAYTMLLHSSGQMLKSEELLFPIASQRTQDLGGQITYAKRYSVTGFLGLAAEDDDDAESASAQVDAKPKSQPKPKSAPAPALDLGPFEQDFRTLKAKLTVKADLLALKEAWEGIQSDMNNLPAEIRAELTRIKDERQAELRANAPKGGAA